MILITGGAGFIGSNIAAALDARDAKGLVVCDRLGTDERWRNIAARPLDDLILPEQLEPWLAAHQGRVETVIHMGAISTTTETDADAILRNNFQLSRRLWEWCAKTDARFLYASSAATFGDGADGFEDLGRWDPDGGFGNRDAEAALAGLRPMNAYGWSKHLFDRFVARRLAEGGARPPQWAGLKFFNVYGPNEYHKGGQRSVVATLFPKLRAGEPAPLFKSYRKGCPHGGQRRDFVWVDDCVDIVLWLMDTPSVNGLFNAGTGTARTFDDLAKAVFQALCRKPRIKYVDMPKSLRPKYQYFTQASLEHLRAAGYGAPFTSLEDGVERYVKGFLATDNPYR